MGTLEIFWAGAGCLAGIAVSFFLVPLWQRSALRDAGARPWLIAASVTVVFLATAFAVYTLKGRPEVATSVTALKTHVSGNNIESSDAGSMQDALGKLSERLSQKGGSDADWQLLQQSYEFLGDTEAANLARQHRLKSNAADAPEPTSSRTAAANTELARYQALVEKNPRDAASWLSIAELQRGARDLAAAGSSYEKVVALNAMTADSWADYADVEASLGSSLRTPAARGAIDSALKIDPKHPKALWLAASLAFEEKQYAQALSLWKRLRDALPANSPDVAVVEANIVEARSLAGASDVQIPNQNSQARVRGTVKLSPALQARFDKNMTLFVYAKTPDGGAPVAVMRAAVESWPIDFELSDAMAMLPSRHLSQYARVSVEARLSSTGQALAQAGDLRSAPVLVATAAAAPVALIIDSVVQ